MKISLVICITGLVLFSIFALDSYKKMIFYKHLAADTIIACGGQLVAIEFTMDNNSKLGNKSSLLRTLASENLDKIRDNEEMIKDSVPAETIQAYEVMVGQLRKISEK
jgi:hypothetical protein